MVRKYTNMVLEMVEQGILDKDVVIMACLKYMSEAEVRDMAEANGFVPEDEEEEIRWIEDFIHPEDFSPVPIDAGDVMAEANGFVPEDEEEEIRSDYEANRTYERVRVVAGQ